MLGLGIWYSAQALDYLVSFPDPFGNHFFFGVGGVMCREEINFFEK